MSVMENWLEVLSSSDVKVGRKLLECLTGDIQYPISNIELYYSLKQLERLYLRGLTIDWISFDTTYLHFDLGVIRRLLSVNEVNIGDNKKHHMISPMQSMHTRDYPLLACLLEPYSNAYMETTLLESAELIHFVMFAKQYYLGQGSTNKHQQFHQLLRSKACFSLFCSTGVSTQEELEHRYETWRAGLSVKEQQKLSKKLLLTSEGIKKNNKRFRSPTTKYTQSISTQTVKISDDIEVKISNQQVLFEEKRGEEVKREVVQRPAPYTSIEVSLEEGKDYTLEQSIREIINGSIISTVDSLLLPLSTRFLRDDEAEQLFKRIGSLLDSEKSLDAALTLLMILTAKSSSALELFELRMSSCFEIDDIEHIDLKHGVWRKPSARLSHAFQANLEQKNLLKEHVEWLELPMPLLLIDVLKDNLKKHTSSQCTLKELVGKKKKIDEKINKFIEPINTNRPLNSAKLRSYLFLNIAHRYDAQVAMLVLNAFEYDNIHHLYYLAEDTELLGEIYREEVVRLLGIPLSEPIELRDRKWVGSQNVLDCQQFSERLSHLFNSLSTRLSSALPTSELQVRELWNDISCYCALMGVISSNHRIRTQYTFTRNTLCLNTKNILISDKYHHNDSAIRVLPMPDVLHEQLIRFSAWQHRLFGKMSPEDKAKVVEFNVSADAAYFGLITDKEVESVGHHHIGEFLGEDWSLPMNVFRHLYCQSIRRDDVARKWAKNFMGHVNSGQHLLSHYSLHSLNHQQNGKNWLERLLTEKLGFKLLPKISSREPHRGTVRDSSAIQVSLTASRIIKFVRKHVDPYWNDLCKGRSDFESVQKQVFDALMAHCYGFSEEHLVIPAHQVIQMVNVYQRFFGKLAGRLGKTLNKHLGLVIDDENLTLSTLLLSDHQLAVTLKEQLCLKIKALDNNHIVSKFVGVVLRTLVYTPISSRGPTLEHLVSMLQKNKIESICGMSYVLLSDDYDRLYLDPMNVMTILNTSFTSVKKEEVINQVNGILKDTFNVLGIHDWVTRYLNRPSVHLENKQYFPHGKIATYEGASLFFCQIFWPHISSVVNSYQAGLVKTHPLSHAALNRFFYDKRYHVDWDTSQQRMQLPISKCNPTDREHVIRCFKGITTRLNGLPASPEKLALGQCILKQWHDLLGLSLTSNLTLKTLRTKTINEYPLVVAMAFEYLYKVSQRPGVKRKNIAKKTVIKYASVAVRPCLDCLWNIDTESLDFEEFEEQYQLILSTNVTAKQRQDRAERLRDFHKTCQREFGLPALHWHDIEPTLKEEKIECNNANIITEQNYQDTLEYIRVDPSLTPTQREQYQLMLMLCYRLGLRPAEAWSLHYNSFTDDLGSLQIATNKRIRLKTPAANRQVLVSMLLNDSEQILLKTKILQASRRDGGIFDSVEYNDGKEICSHYLTRLLRHVTGDHTVRLYHARHSTATYLYLMLSNSVETGISQQLMKWARVKNYSELCAFRNKLLVAFVGDEREWFHSLYALAGFMGHAEPKTTLQYYVHVIDLQLYIEHAREYVSKDSRHHQLNRALIAEWSSLSPTAFRQKFSREKAKDWKFSAIISASKKSKNQERLSLPPVKFERVEGSSSCFGISREEVLDRFLQVNHQLHLYLIRDAYNHTLDDSHFLNLAKKSSRELKVSLFMGIDRNKFTNGVSSKTLANYYHKPLVNLLFQRLALLSFEEQNQLINTLTKLNYANGKYVFGIDDTESQVREITKKLGLTYNISNDQESLKVSNRIEYLSKLFFFKDKDAKKSINQQLAYVCVVARLAHLVDEPFFELVS
ncbi:site-specific integrase [Vibrio cyclitrophicus]|uniref:hypothetical protein n=1 Tax=Vibrio cyclitrophicus TaxID=47951 RepID=UPI0003184B1F|nr:hypothetical protein [Vibrio cyclitrophicus]OEF32437.1 hypothetical protein OA9_19990 [Vibrio cyclitrophicus 1F97]